MFGSAILSLLFRRPVFSVILFSVCAPPVANNGPPVFLSRKTIFAHKHCPQFSTLFANVHTAVEYSQYSNYTHYNTVQTVHTVHTVQGSTHSIVQYSALAPAQGEGPPVCYDVRNMDCTVHGIGASKFPLEQQENLNIELLREVEHIF
jgi:hypothetical protein